jgi:MFS family permease
MRAPGFAVLTLGAVVALSAVFGLSYRSEASPYDDPATSAPVTSPPSDSASDDPYAPAPTSSAPSAPPSSSESPTPSDPPTSSSPSPSPTVHGPNPTITVVSFSPGGATFTISLSGGAGSAVTTLFRQGDPTARQSCASTTCAFTGLSGGSWVIQTVQTFPDGSTSYPTLFSLQVPDAPTVTVGTAPFGISGTGSHDGDLIHVTLDDGTHVCDAVVQGGVWSCPGVTPPTTPGTYHYVVVEQEPHSGAQSSPNAVAFDVTPSPDPTPSASASAPAPSPSSGNKSFSLTTLATWAFTVLGIDLNHVHPGDHFTVTGTDLPPGAIVTGELHSTVVSVGRATVAQDGTFALPVTVPMDFEAGAHELVLTLTDPSGVAVAAQQPLIVEPTGAGSSAGSSPTADPGTRASGAHTSTDPLGSESAIGGSNILTHGLNSIADVIRHPEKVPAALEIGLVLLIFAILPSHLLNATLAEQYERFVERRPHLRRRAPRWWARLHALLNRAPFLAGLALTTVTALLFALADPRFGFTLASLRLLLGLAIALALVTYLTNAVVSRIMRSRWKVDVEVSLRPLGLVLTVVGVAVSRILDFSPGFLVGLVLGLVIQEKSVKQHAWRAVLLRTSILLGLALVAWLGYSLFDTEHEGGTFASELAIETLVAITTEAIVGLLIELLPLRLLEGQKLFEKSHVLWGALYVVTTVIFVVAVVPWEGNWAELGGSLWAWLGIAVGFGILATGVYLYFRIRTPRESSEAGADAGAEAEADGDELVPIGSEDE